MKGWRLPASPPDGVRWLLRSRMEHGVWTSDEELHALIATPSNQN